MKKELKDYLHLYWGCQVEYTEKLILGNIEKRKALFIGMEDRYVRLSQITINGKMGNNFSRTISDIKPILRPLSDMTDEESNSLETAMWGNWQDPQLGDKESVLKMFINDEAGDRPGYEITVKATNWFRRNGFDVDGLIEAGLAIDKTTLKQQS